MTRKPTRSPARYSTRSRSKNIKNGAVPASASPAADAPVIVALVVGLAALWLGMLLAVGLALLLLLSPDAGPPDAALAAAAALGMGLIGLPLSWYAWRRLRGRGAQAWRPPARVGAILGLGALLPLICGQLSLSVGWLAAIVLAPASLLVVGLPAFVLAASALRGGAGISKLRAWAHVASGAWLATLLALLVELSLAASAGIVILIVLGVSAPDALAQIAARLEAFSATGDVEPLLDWLLRPWVMASAIAAFALIVPAIEELFKPIGVVLLFRRKPTPMAAFAGGVLGGIGFAVAESLGNLAGASNMWAFAAITRLTTLVMHSFTGGLVGWGWGQVFAGRGLRRLVYALLGAIGVHGLWNGVVVAMITMGALFTRRPPMSAQFALGIGIALALGLMFALLVGCLLALGWIPRRVRDARPD